MGRALADFNASEYGDEYVPLKQDDVVHLNVGIAGDQGYAYGVATKIRCKACCREDA